MAEISFMMAMNSSCVISFSVQFIHVLTGIIVIILDMNAAIGNQN